MAQEVSLYIADSAQGAGAAGTKVNPAQFDDLVTMVLPVSGVFEVIGGLYKAGTDDAQFINAMFKGGDGVDRQAILTPLAVFVPWIIPRMTGQAGQTIRLYARQASAQPAVTYYSTICITRLD